MSQGKGRGRPRDSGWDEVDVMSTGVMCLDESAMVVPTGGCHQGRRACVVRVQAG